jgi:kynurenine formamidase
VYTSQAAAFPESRHPVSVSSSQVVYDALKANGIRVLLRTGWSRRTGAQEFLNVGPDGPHSPGFHKEATLFLIHERDVLGVGVETVGRDAGQAGTFDPPFPNHTLMHGAVNIWVEPILGTYSRNLFSGTYSRERHRGVPRLSDLFRSGIP